MLRAAALLMLGAGYADAQETSVGSCYDPSTHQVGCNVAEADCTGSWYAAGYVSGYTGCCHCVGSCDHSQETADDCAGTGYQPNTGDSAGSCYDPSTHAIDCNIAEADCAGAYYAPGHIGSAGGGAGCCHCAQPCDHTAETGEECSSKYYAMKGHSVGSCYNPSDHSITCNTAEDACAGSYYAPGYISKTRSGCCHCALPCDHTTETGEDCASQYYPDASATPPETESPTAATESPTAATESPTAAAMNTSSPAVIVVAEDTSGAAAQGVSFAVVATMALVSLLS